MLQYKNFIDTKDQHYIHEPLTEKRWGVFHTSLTNHDSHFFSQLKLSPETDPYFYGPLLDKIQSVIPDKIKEVERVYFNGHYGGDSGELHQDDNCIKARTFLIYCNEHWEPDWGGGTIIKPLDNSEEYTTAYPYPRSAIYFEGVRWHCALPINRLFKGIRISLAYKLKVE